MNELERIREEINEIDGELLPLFLRRMDASRRVAEYKREHHLPVFHAERERQILNRVAEQAGEYADAAQLLYSSIMDVSRALQHDQLGGGKVLRRQIETALSARPAPARGRVACAGVDGSYTGEAGRMLYPESELLFRRRFEDVFRAVDAGEADYGIIPVENSSAGSVTEVYDLIIKYRFSICAGTELRISHCLLAQPGARLEDIKTVYSHPQALSQCSGFLEQNALRPVESANTAVAAETVAGAGDPAAAAIASRQSAELYGLSILKEGIQNSRENYTRFISISKTPHIPKDADKISLCFSLPHETGSLYRILSRFALRGLNLTKIESRPILDKPFEYLFYLDFSGNAAEERTVNLLCALSDELPRFTFLGNYRENKPDESI